MSRQCMIFMTNVQNKYFIWFGYWSSYEKIELSALNLGKGIGVPARLKLQPTSMSVLQADASQYVH